MLDQASPPGTGRRVAGSPETGRPGPPERRFPDGVDLPILRGGRPGTARCTCGPAGTAVDGTAGPTRRGGALRITPYLRSCVQHHASDVHIKADAPPRLRISGVLVPLDTAPLSTEECEALVAETMGEGVRRRFLTTHEADYALTVPGIGRFRANAFRTGGAPALVLRKVADRPMRLDELEVPDVLGRLALEPRGLVLVTGPTGSGKTTTLAAMVHRINETRPVHILTIEDPIEVKHHDIRASISQRELWTDTADWASAMRSAMREDPDVILIGEMRDPVTVSAALSAAETGHLVMSTLHTTDAVETINRVVDFFPPHEQKQARGSLAQSLKGVVCQRLVPRLDGSGRVCVMEILVNTERVAEAILDPDKTHTIPDLVAAGGYDGMQAFDRHLVQLVLDRVVTVAAAKAAASRPADLAVLLKRAGVHPGLVDG